ncbi:hypothetical protein [Leucobacter manosquensis]|uniref:Uncharacterized protein n=1 Tax=Leucobacter manosquensis TaxID=2810611 RepID=A0ABS5M1X6_9MICO|nr:hypothetical protein [Leucobacter manosquensis]MBS3181174.1 hypothetical protein [Leucobacter manosquensis]
MTVTFPIACMGVFATEPIVGVDAVQVTKAGDSDGAPAPFCFGAGELHTERFEPRFVVCDRAVDDGLSPELNRELTIFQGLTEIGISEVGG